MVSRAKKRKEAEEVANTVTISRSRLAELETCERILELQYGREDEWEEHEAQLDAELLAGNFARWEKGRPAQTDEVLADAFEDLILEALGDDPMTSSSLNKLLARIKSMCDEIDIREWVCKWAESDVDDGDYTTLPSVFLELGHRPVIEDYDHGPDDHGLCINCSPYENWDEVKAALVAKRLAE